MEDRLRLGQFVTERRGAHFEEIWNDGYAFNEVHKKLAAINAEREEIARASQLLRKRKPSTSSLSSMTSGGAASSSGTGSGGGSSKKQQQQYPAAALGVGQINCGAAVAVLQAAGGGVAAASGSASLLDGFAKPELPKE